MHFVLLKDENELIELIDDFKTIQKFSGYHKKMDNQFYKLVGFVYDCLMNFMETD